MIVLANGRLVFRHNGERTAYIVMEYVTGARTQIELAERLGLSHQRVCQLVAIGHSRVGCKPGDPREKIAAGWRLVLRQPSPQNSIEDFTAHELTFRGEFDPYA